MSGCFRWHLFPASVNLMKELERTLNGWPLPPRYTTWAPLLPEVSEALKLRKQNSRSRFVKLRQVNGRKIQCLYVSFLLLSFHWPVILWICILINIMCIHERCFLWAACSQVAEVHDRPNKIPTAAPWARPLTPYCSEGIVPCLV